MCCCRPAIPAFLAKCVSDCQQSTRSCSYTYPGGFHIWSVHGGNCQCCCVKHCGCSRDPRLIALHRRGHGEHGQHRMSVGNHAEPVLPCLPHIACDACSLAPYEQRHRSWWIASTNV